MIITLTLNSDRSVVHILSDPVPALLTPVTKGES
jgi:hypothetical protein